MIRIAAVGDIHFGHDLAGSLRPALQKLSGEADLVLIAGDLTRSGAVEEARVLADELAGLATPVVAVLGNHDYHQDKNEQIQDVLTQAGVAVLEGEMRTLEFDGVSVGIAGSKGFGGGFAGACGTDFGEPEMKSFIRHTKRLAQALQESLESLQTDVRIALLHFSPVKGTLMGEKLEIYPFLGSYLLGEAIDNAGADLVFHGHAHGGTEHGVTPGGIHVRNVAQPLIKHPFNLYCLEARKGLVNSGPQAERSRAGSWAGTKSQTTMSCAKT